jgi:AraC-like DNA-binding protein
VISAANTESTFWETRPHPALRPFVDRLWARTAADGAPPLRILPDGCIDLLVHASDPSKSFAVGTMTRAMVFEPRRAVRIAAVRFRPGGAAPFLRVAAEELTDGIVEMRDLGVRWLTPATIPEGAHLRDAVRAIERALLERLAVVGMPDPTMAYAIAALSGAVVPSVDALARTIGWSRQHLGRSFRHGVGVSPKQFARVARLQRAVIHLQRAQRKGLADAAASLGYFDQAHMNRDFRELAGISPGVVAAAGGSIYPIRSLFGGA